MSGLEEEWTAKDGCGAECVSAEGLGGINRTEIFGHDKRSVIMASKANVAHADEAASILRIPRIHGVAVI